MIESIRDVIGYLLLAAVVSSPVSCTIYESKLLAAEAARGGDPVRLQCAMSAQSNREVCRTLALREAAK